MESEGRFQEAPSWRRAMDLAVEVYRLTEPLRSGSAARLAGQIADAAARVPSRIAQSRSRSGLEAGRARGQAEAALLETETLLHLAVRLGALSDIQPALSLIQELHALLLRPQEAPPEEPPKQRTPPGAGTGIELANGRRVAPAAVHESRTAEPGPGGGPRADPQAHGVDRLVVDGCNFLGRVKGYSLGDLGSRDRLLFRLQEYARRHPAHRVAIFFDGQRASRKKTAGVEEHVTSGQRTADDVMIDLLHALPVADRRRTTLVTDDQELTRRARGEGVRVQGTAWLAERLDRKGPDAGGVRKTSGLNQTELDDWEDFFSQPPERPGR